MQNENNPIEISESVIFSVSEVTLHLKQVLETQVEALYITGEIGNYIKHGSGHIYFNLKDDNAVIRCAFFRNQNYQLDFLPQDGDQVVCFGRITIFEKSGQYQLLIQNMFPYGKGALQQQFEQLKMKLKAEGLFDSEHKKPLPKYPESIGIITSPTGAALQDILNVLERRFPCHVKVYPALMQGKDSPNQVIKGLKYFNQADSVDLIIIARGGGSQEDLFCFNDEELARTIYKSELPVVSAIGHEIDFTIADFVSDLRAPTPSAAAEITVPETSEVEKILDKYAIEIYTMIKQKLNRLKNSVHVNQIKLIQFNPERILQSYQQRFDEAETKLSKFNELILRTRGELTHSSQLFEKEFVYQSKRLLQLNRHLVEISAFKFKSEMKAQIQKAIHRLELVSAVLSEVSPRNILDRGYSLVRKNGKIIKSVKSIKIDDKLELIISDGNAEVSVSKLNATGKK